MFTWFSENKANYNKGQVFPFLIAALAIIIIMAMITANLGKISIFKTDVSNAADAGALSGASILSGWLLGIGLNSDTWCGTAVITTARMMEIFILGRDDINVPSFSLRGSTEEGGGEGEDEEAVDLKQFGQDLAAAIKLYIPHLMKFFFAYIRALEDAIMACSNAKQTALRVAFQNSGVDEQPAPEKKFKHYTGAYDSYVKSFLSKEENQTGFSRFMSHPVSGYGEPLGEIEPGKLSDLQVTSGYGWSQITDPNDPNVESFKSSFLESKPYADYDNYVEVKVHGSVTYPLQTLTFVEYFGAPVVDALTAMVGVGSWIKYWNYDEKIQALKETVLGIVLAVIVCLVFCAVTAAAFRGMVEYLPCGFTFKDREMKPYTTDNPIVVHVKRHKKNTNMGMWNFQYGDIVGKSAAHAFQENDLITIEPVLIESMKDLGNFLGSVTGDLADLGWSSPQIIIDIVQQAICQGLVWSMGFIISGQADAIADMIRGEAPDCDHDDHDCWIEWAVYMSAAATAAGMIAADATKWLLEYVIYRALCDSDDRVTIGDGDVTTTFGKLMNGTTSDWFKTDLHLFETELYSKDYIE